MKHFLSFFICLLLLGGCNSTNSQQDSSTFTDSLSLIAAAILPDTFETGNVISKVICKNDTSQSYALYIPKSIDETGAQRIIYFFDSHGDGSFPLIKYQSLAEEFGVILIGSNNSKNGNDWNTTSQIWSTISADTKSRFKIDDTKIYCCGFSGGAKVAGYIAINNPGIRGVILNGAGFNEQPPSNGYNFDFIGLAGEGDMNMTDLVLLESQLTTTPMRHELLLFDGKHEWAPLLTMRDAFLWIMFNEMKDKSTPVDEKLISNFLAAKKKTCEELSLKKQFIKLENICAQVLNYMNGLNADVTYFKSIGQKIVEDKNYKQQLIVHQNLLTTEQNTKQYFAQNLQNIDLDLWTETVKDLNKKAKSSTPDAPMNQRLLAYLSLASYSISNRFISQNQNEQASKYVELYKMVDPENSEAWYFSAILNARLENSEAAENDLIAAIEIGFKDSNRINLQSEFQMLNPPLNFQKLNQLISKK